MSGHPSGNRMNCIFHLHSFFFEQLIKFMADMLSLGNCQSITRDNNNFL